MGTGQILSQQFVCTWKTIFIVTPKDVRTHIVYSFHILIKPLKFKYKDKNRTYWKMEGINWKC